MRSFSQIASFHVLIIVLFVKYFHFHDWGRIVVVDDTQPILPFNYVRALLIENCFEQSQLNLFIVVK